MTKTAHHATKKRSSVGSNKSKSGSISSKSSHKKQASAARKPVANTIAGKVLLADGIPAVAAATAPTVAASTVPAVATATVVAAAAVETPAAATAAAIRTPAAVVAAAAAAAASTPAAAASTPVAAASAPPKTATASAAAQRIFASCTKRGKAIASWNLKTLRNSSSSSSSSDGEDMGTWNKARLAKKKKETQVYKKIAKTKLSAQELLKQAQAKAAAGVPAQVGVPVENNCSQISNITGVGDSEII